MSQFVIVTDSSCDLSHPMAEEIGLTVVPLTVVADGKPYTNYLDWREIPAGDYYQILREEKPAATSAANMEDFLRAMEPLLERGMDILYLGFSSALSSTCSTGMLAAQELREKYPDRKVLCVDTLCASLGQGLLVWHVWNKQKSGCTIEETAAYAEEIKLHLCHWFTVSDLHFLQRGGRVSKTTAVIGSALQIKPVMHVDNEGRLIKIGTARCRRASIVALKDHLKETITHPEKQTIFISHGDCMEDAQALADMVRKEVPVKDVVINYVGPVIGCHSGPGTLALFHLGTHR